MCGFEASFISVNPFHPAPWALLATYGASVRVCLLFVCGSRFEVRGRRTNVQQLRRVAGRGSRIEDRGSRIEAGGGRIGRRLGWSLVAGSRVAGSRIEEQQLRRVAGGPMLAASIQCRPGETRVRRIGSSLGSIDGQRVQTLESIDGIGTSRFRPKRATRGSRGNGLDLVSRK